MKINCMITGTHSYLFALEACIRRIRAAVYHARKRRDIDLSITLMTDKEGAELVPPDGGRFPDKVIAIDMEEGGVRYKQEAQLLIANLQQRGMQDAIEQGADMCWSVEVDVLVPHNALSCSLDMLEFDDGYYDVAFVTYPSQSGGMFLGGHGSPCHPIERDHLPEERDVPEDVQDALRSLEAWLKEPPEGVEQSEVGKKVEELHALQKELEKYPPKGNIFELNGKKWRRRGWLDNAYPAIGRGAVLPTDWTGMGCTLMNSKSLAAAAFDGYEGGGTQDLFLNQRRWKSNDMRMCVITHAVCEHVVAKNDDEGRRVHCFAHHEPQGECKGHLRVQHRPFYQFNGSDGFDEKNDGIIMPREEPPKEGKD